MISGLHILHPVRCIQKKVRLPFKNLFIPHRFSFCYSITDLVNKTDIMETYLILGSLIFSCKTFLQRKQAISKTGWQCYSRVDVGWHRKCVQHSCWWSLWRWHEALGMCCSTGVCLAVVLVWGWNTEGWWLRGTFPGQPAAQGLVTSELGSGGSGVWACRGLSGGRARGRRVTPS